MFSCWERRWIDDDGALETLSATAAIFSDVRTVFGFTRFGLSMRMSVSFTFFWQYNEHTKVTVLLFFQNPYAIFAHILQHYHDFQSNVAIFPSVDQVYTQPYSFGGRIKLIICEIRHKLMVFSFLSKNVHFISKNAILCLFLKNVSPSKRVICFILNNLHFPMVAGIAFYARV